MFLYFRLWFGPMTRCFRSHRTLLLENLALRQQLAVLKRRHPRARLHPMDTLFWVLARQFWAGWKKSLLVDTPETVVRWHRQRIRLLPVARQNPRSRCRISVLLELDLEGDKTGSKICSFVCSGTVR